ncbi:MAG: hypothetical protein VW395_08440, partial [Methylotenera sp.]
VYADGNELDVFAETDVYISVSDDIVGNIDISALNSGSGYAFDGNVYANVIANDSSDVYAYVYGNEVDVRADTYVDVEVGGDIIGNIDISATNSGNAVVEGGSVDADVVDGFYSYADADVYGNHVETYAETEVNIDVDGNISGDITISAGNSGDATVTDGEYSAVYARAYADVEINVGGSVSGDIAIGANNSGNVDISGSEYSVGYAYSYVYAYISIGEDLTGDITVDAVNTGDTVVELLSDLSYAITYARVYSEIEVGGNVSGDITFTATNSGDAFAGNVSDNSDATSVTYARNQSDVAIQGNFTGAVTLTALNSGNVVNFGDVNVFTSASVQSVIYVDDQVDTDITITSTNEGTDGFAIAELEFTGGSGNINTVTLEAADLTEENSGGAAIDFELNQDSGRFDGGIGVMNVDIGNSGYVSADISLTDYIDRLSINADDASGNGDAHIYVDQGTHGGDVYINNEGSTSTSFWLTYEDATADRIYLGSYLDNDVLTAGEFDGSFLNLGLNMDDRDLSMDNFTQYNQLIAEMLSIYGASETNFELYFENITGSGFEDGGLYGTLSDFLGAADDELDGTTDYYFGVVGGNGYLAYDQDGVGITMLIQFDDLTAFSSSLITNTITP